MNERKPPLSSAPVVEFVGPPGTGKTTSCHYFAKELQKEGLRVCLLEDLEKYFEESTFRHKLVLVFESCIAKGHIILLYMLTLLYKRVFDWDSYTRYLSLIIRERALKRLLKEKKFDIVLLDQWSIQSLWSSTIFHIKPSSKFKEYLHYFYLKVEILLYLEVSPAIAAHRMEQRQTFRSRFDEMDINTRNEELSKYNNYLFQLFLGAGCKNKRVFSTVQHPSENLNEFMSFISPFKVKGYTNTNASKSPESEIVV